VKGLLVVGAGGHGRVVADAARESGAWGRIAFLDARYPDLSNSGDWQVIGKDTEAMGFREEFSDLVVAIGDAYTRVGMLDDLLSDGFSLPAIIHPHASVSRGVELGEGCVILAQAAVNFGAVVGRGCIINTGATVDHDCSLGDGVHVCPGAHLSGEVKVGEHSWLGVGSSVIQQVKIGADTTVGAGSVVTGDLPDGVTAVGVPATVNGC
jgi:sugar O-acyltransferase (sialic acid O-acetyltransferase NeuD family)